MTRILPETEIDALLHEHKQLPANWRSRLQTRPKSNMAFAQRDMVITGVAGNDFKLVLRLNRQSPFDFSIILIYIDNDGTEYILRRHNGAHPSRHTNRWEKLHGIPDYELPVCYHIHLATERYQQAGLKIDGFAERTVRYQDYQGALLTLFDDGGFVIPDSRGSQMALLGE